MKPSKKTLLYTVYIIGITVFFLWHLFPSESLKAYLAYRLAQGNPDVRVTIDRISPVLPPGIKLHNVGIAHQNKALIDLKNFKVMPGLGSLFSDTTTVNFKGRVCEGTLNGQAQFSDRQDGTGIKIEGWISGVQVQQVSALKQLSENQISGGLGGNFVYDGSAPTPSLAANLSLTNCRVELATPIFDQKSFEFKTIAADLAMQNNSLQIEQLSARGNQLDLDLSGSIALNESDPTQNALNLTGNVTPHHVFLAKIEKEIPVDFLRKKQAGKNAFAFKVDGTLDEPGFSLN
jgi:type II secretion system protein N